MITEDLIECVSEAIRNSPALKLNDMSIDVLKSLEKKLNIDFSQLNTKDNLLIQLNHLSKEDLEDHVKQLIVNALELIENLWQDNCRLGGNIRVSYSQNVTVGDLNVNN